MLKKIRSLVSNSNFIETYDNTLSQKECDIILSQFEASPQLTGVTSKGYRPHRKKCVELRPKFSEGDQVSNILYEALILPIEKYKKKHECVNHISHWKIDDDYNIKKYELEDDGYKGWHTEQGPGEFSKRVLVWMIYLNNAKSGTDFMNYPTISSKMGRCVLWPSSFTHVHRSHSNKGLKYIASGWMSFT